MNYPIIRNKKTPNTLTPTYSSYSDAYAQRMCSLYLSDEIHMDTGNRPHKYYRLHARDAHNEDMALAYEVKCPACSNTMKQIGRTQNYNDLGLYICKSCDKN